MNEKREQMRKQEGSVKFRNLFFLLISWPSFVRHVAKGKKGELHNGRKNLRMASDA